MAKANAKAKEPKKEGFGAVGDKIINTSHQGGIKTPMDTKIPCIYDKGYYDSTYSTQKLEGLATSLLGWKASDNEVKQIISYIRRRTYVDPEAIHVSKFSEHVCLENGVLNLKTMKLEEHHPAKFIRYKIQVKYDKDVSSEPIYKYVASMVARNHCDKVQEHTGNIFSNHYLTKKLMFATGPQDSGKSTFYNVLCAFLGQVNYCILTLNELGEKFTNAIIYNKRANICSDIPYKMPIKHYGRIKNVTGGDGFTIQQKHGTPFTYKPMAKEFFSANEVPIIDERAVDDAFYGRFDFADFPHSFTVKNPIFDMYTTPEMKTAFLNWMIEGYERLKDNKWELTNGDSVDDVKARFEEASYEKTTFDDWLIENYESDEKGWILKAFLFRDCATWHRAKSIVKDSFITSYPVFCKKLLNNRQIKVVEYQPSQNGKQVESYKGIKRREKQ